MPATPTSFKGHLVTQAIAFVCFLLVPALITLVAPFTDLEFRHAGNGVNVTVTRYALMVIPWQTKTVTNVTALQSDITPEVRYANTAENRRKGRAGAVSHATGQLTIIGDGSEVVVQAAPELAGNIEVRFNRFRADASSAPLKLSIYASWNLSYLLGGAVTALAAFYVLGCVLAILSLPFKALKATGKA